MTEISKVEMRILNAKAFFPVFIKPSPPVYMPEKILDVVSEINPFEPKNLKEFVGQENTKEVLQIIVDSANIEHRLIPNILLTGPYGHGKTTLAKIIARRHHKKIEITDGNLAATVIKPSKTKIYIVDEAHNIPPQVADSYNILIDAGELRIIACTTNPGNLSSAFRSRFRTLYLVNYTVEDITKIIKRAANRAKIKITNESVAILGKRSKCNPRNALNLLAFVQEVASLSSQKEQKIPKESVQVALSKLGIDGLGLNSLDRKYLSLLKIDIPVGLQYISSVLAQDVATIQNEIEPYLIQGGFVERTARGRILGNILRGKP
jgi:Holliday junction DNA helicase RuvB